MSPRSAFAFRTASLRIAASVTAIGLLAAIPTRLPGEDAGPGWVTQQAARTAIYYDPGRSGEGLFVESLGGDRALVYFLSFTSRWYFDPWWGPYDLSPTASWMIGLGQYQGDHLVADLVMPAYGHFGAAFDPHEIHYIEFGSLDFQFPTCATGESRGSLQIHPLGDMVMDDDGWEFEVIENRDNYVQLSQVIDCETGIEKASPAFNNTGSWYDPSRPGEGLVVEVLENDRAIVVWLTYDNEGNQMWLQGIGVIDRGVGGNGLLIIDDMRTYSGGYWGSDFNAADVTSTHFGGITLSFWLCDYADLSYDSLEYGSGSLSLTRLTSPLNVNPAGGGCWDY